jgi:steroid 5-alpha reductase family enzyme
LETNQQKTRALLIVTGIYVVSLAAGLVAAVWIPTPNLLLAALVGDCVATIVVFTTSRVAGNSSLYDPYWSVVPPFIAAFWIAGLATMGQSAFGTQAVIALIVAGAPLLIWAVRLTANWVRRWEGTKDEDWRYSMLKEQTGRFDWFIDFAGIHLFPTLQVFLGMIPLFFLLDGLLSGFPGTRASWAALVAGAAIMLAAVALESAADRQLARFREAGGKGLLTSGVWGVVKHPNYLGEILFWWGLWVASLAGAIPIWTVAGPLAMTALFLFISIPMMDRHLKHREHTFAVE